MNGTTRAKMSIVINKRFEIRFKAVTTRVFTVVGLLVKLPTSISKPRGYI